MFVTAVFTDGNTINLRSIDRTGWHHGEVIPEVAVIGAVADAEVDATTTIGGEQNGRVEVIDNCIDDHNESEGGYARSRGVVVCGGYGNVVGAHSS